MYTDTFVRVSGRAVTEREMGKQTWRGAREVVAWHVMKQTMVPHLVPPPVWYAQLVWYGQLVWSAQLVPHKPSMSPSHRHTHETKGRKA